jgi:2-dehydro-3-deoxygalactonokinase
VIFRLDFDCICRCGMLALVLRLARQVPGGEMPRLLALDWGTSSLRAFLMDTDGSILGLRSSGYGIQHLPEPGGIAGYQRAFMETCGDWATDPSLPVVAGGMVGSAQGWIEAPYVSCPADVSTLAERAAAVALPNGGRMLIAPGVLLDQPDVAPDVIRGEEIQIAGALSRHADWGSRACFVLPGTHSKWVLVENGRIVDFATYMTGELFAVLTAHSILGRLMPATSGQPALDDAAFDKGLARAATGQAGELSHQLFSARTMGLTGRIPGEGLADYLSGLLIGQETVSAPKRLMRTTARLPERLIVIGEGALCHRYVRALKAAGLAVTAEVANTAPDGLYRFAEAAGLIAAPRRPEEKLP